MDVSPTVFLTIICLILEVDSIIGGLKCPPLTIRKGRVRLRSKGRIAKYTCLRGFQLLGDRYSTCLRGRWDTPPPVCISDGCLSVSSEFPHGQTFESYRGGLVKFQCDPGYRLIGSPALYCNSISWNDTIPVCREITTKAQRWCDFESEDLCGWTHDVSHDFDWKRHNFATPSGHVGTGPAFDHTLGAGLDGHYMYLEASNPRLENDTARLFSPVFPAVNNNDSCFIFWYHMYGENIGSLQVYRYDQNISLLFVEFGNQGNQWKKAVVPLQPVDSSFQIVIEGVRGAGYKGDTAIDDVKLTEGDECSDEPTTDAVSILGTCQGRCHNKDIAVDTSACDCTADCIDNSTCCSDFLALCGIIIGTPVPRFTAFTSVPLTNQPLINNLSSALPTKSSESVIYILPTRPSSYNFTITNTVQGISGKRINELSKQTLPSTTVKFSTIKPLTQNTKPSPIAQTPSPPSVITGKPFSVSLYPNLATTNISMKPSTATPWYKIILFNATSTVKPTLSTSSDLKNKNFPTLVTKSPNVTLYFKNPILYTPFTFFPKFKPSIIPKQFYNTSLNATLKPIPITTRPTFIFRTPPPTFIFRTPPPPFIFRTPPPPFVLRTPSHPFTFRTPQFNFGTKDPGKTAVKQTLKPNLLTSTIARKTEFPTKIPQFKTEQNLTKNSVLNPYWEKPKPPRITTLSPIKKIYKLLNPARSLPVSAQTTSSVITDVVTKKFKSKYKRKDIEAAQVRMPKQKLTAGIAAVLGLLTLLVVATAVTATTCYVRKRRINRRDMDGEADVLFLTSDEILDFRLARPNTSETSVCESQR